MEEDEEFAALDLLESGGERGDITVEHKVAGTPLIDGNTHGVCIFRALGDIRGKWLNEEV